MLIQVVANYRNIIVPPVTLVTAGDDLFPVCDLMITLTAIVIPVINLPLHTVLWEQIGGTPIILTNNDQLTTSYTRLSNDKTDKSFKITIDKGEINEQSDIVIVYSTPASFLSGSYGKAQTKIFTPADAVPCNSIIATASADVPLPDGGIKDFIPDSIFDISWSLPQDPVLAPWLVDMNIFEDGQEVGSPPLSYLPTDTLVYAGKPASYNILSNFLVNGQPSSANSCVKDLSATIIPSVRAIDDRFGGVGFAKSDVKFTKFLNTQRIITDPVVSGFASSDTKITQFINKVINDIINDDVLMSGFARSESLITRTDPGGIGGG